MPLGSGILQELSSLPLDIKVYILWGELDKVIPIDGSQLLLRVSIVNFLKFKIDLLDNLNNKISYMDRYSLMQSAKPSKNVAIRVY